MNLKNLIIGGIAGGLLVLAGAWASFPTEKIIERVIEKKVGAVTSNEFNFRDASFNGNKFHYLRQEFGPSSVQGATTTPCSFQLSDGVNATTSIVGVTVQGNTATSATIIWNIATSSTAFATTSPIVPQRTVANQRFSFDIAMSTTSLVAASSTWLVVGAKVSDAAGSGYIPSDISGVCTAITQEL